MKVVTEEIVTQFMQEFAGLDHAQRSAHTQALVQALAEEQPVLASFLGSSARALMARYGPNTAELVTVCVLDLYELLKRAENAPPSGKPAIEWLEQLWKLEPPAPEEQS